jgi:hypothetical protein
VYGFEFGSSNDAFSVLGEYFVREAMTNVFCDANHVSNGFAGFGRESTVVEFVVHFFVEVKPK